MNKAFLSNILLVLGVNLLIKPLYVFGVEAEVQNVVGPENYGLYFALFNLAFLYQFFVDLGLQNYTSRFVGEKPERFKKHFSIATGSKLVLSVIFILLIIASFFLLGYAKEHLNLLILVSCQMALVSLIMFVRSNISALSFFRFDSLLSVVDKLLLLMLLAYILYFSSYRDSFDIIHFVQLQIIVSLIVLFIGLGFLLQQKGFIAPSFSFGESRKLLKQTYPFALVFLVMTLYTKMDGVMLSRLLDDNNYQAGVYAGSYRIIDALNMIGFLFGGLLLPMFAQLKSSQERNELWQLAFTLMLTISSIGLAAGLLYSDEILQWLYTDYQTEYSKVFYGLILSYFVMSIAYLFGLLVTAKGSIRRLNLVYLSGVVMNWILNFILIPQYLAVGAAYATLATQITIIIGLIYLSVNDLHFQIPLKLIIKSVVFLLITLGVFYTFKSLNLANWVITMSFSAALSILVSFLLSLLRLDYLKTLKNPNL